jgi:hypothetical protein
MELDLKEEALELDAEATIAPLVRMSALVQSVSIKYHIVGALPAHNLPVQNAALQCRA